MPYGYNGKILRVDLDRESISVEEPHKNLYSRYLGGGTLALHYLLSELKPKSDPLGPDNILVFAGSVISGTPATGLSRFSVAAKSPLTSAFGEAEAGGWWIPELKFAGYDAIVIKGKASRPVYLWIHDDEAEIRDARLLWGKFTKETQEEIRKELGDDRIRIASIGPAGEKLVRVACILNELKHANGRTGLGAVMGSKNLKAIAVRGKKRMEVVDEESVKRLTKWVKETYEEPYFSIGNLGTARITVMLSEQGILPTLNFREGSFEGAEAISGETMSKTILVRRGTCYGCFVRCKREVQVTEPYSVDPVYGGPEYETIAAFGSMCGIDDLKAISWVNQLCNAYGLDTISTGGLIAFAMECYENGILKKGDTGGIDLRFRNVEAMIKMVEMIAKREGLGDLLADGMSAAAKKFGKGADRFAMHVKGMPLPFHEPRGKAGVGLGYAVSATGPDHMEIPHDPFWATEAGIALLRPLGILEPVDVLNLGPKKVRLFIYLQQYWDLLNSLGICMFTAKPMGPHTINEIVDYVKAVTGWETSLFDLLKVGERHANMARVFNLREGFTSKDDTLPERLFSPMEGGTLKGKKIDKEQFSKAVETYYEMMGWDPESGIPKKEKLAELDIDWLI
ncbi:MAG: aldehyde ferredoxin oxidoreductase family protein [Thermodesulfobacteriota bacterium]